MHFTAYMHFHFCAVDIHMKGVGESQHMEFTLIPIPKAPGTGSMSDSEEEVYLTTEYNQGACNSDTGTYCCYIILCILS